MKSGTWNSFMIVALMPTLGLAATESDHTGAELRKLHTLFAFGQRVGLTETTAGLIPTLTACLLAPATTKRKAGVWVPEGDVKAIIKRYKVDDEVMSVKAYVRQMPSPVHDEEFRRSIHASLPAEFIPYLITDPALTLATRRALAPVLELYSRIQVYDIVLLNHPVPLLMSDSGVLLCLTTGLLRRMESEDELLGYVAHEVGHEWLVRRTVELKRQYEGFLASGADKQANLTKEKLALIELEADSFASLSLAYLGRTPVEYARSIELVAEEYSDISIGYHPPACQRAQVIKSIVPQRRLHLTPRKTAEFIALQKALTKTTN
jgi:hypothetical protein